VEGEERPIEKKADHVNHRTDDGEGDGESFELG
jgi:hypothetical protein